MDRKKNKHKSKGRTRMHQQDQSIPQQGAQSSVDGENTRVEEDQFSKSRQILEQEQHLDLLQGPSNQEQDLADQEKYTKHNLGKGPSQKSEEQQALSCGLETDSPPRQQLAAFHLPAAGMVDKDLLEWSMMERIANESVAASHEVTVAGRNAQQDIEDTLDAGKKTLDTHLLETKQKLETAGNTKIKEIEKSTDKIRLQGANSIEQRYHSDVLMMGGTNIPVINREAAANATESLHNDKTKRTDETNTQIFQASTMIVNNHVSPKDQSKGYGAPIKKSQTTLFRKCVKNFDDNEFLLFIDTLDEIPETVSTALVKWLGVFDLDQGSWTKGLFAKLSDKFSKSVYQKDYSDALTINHNSLNWVKTLGCSDNPNTLVDKDPKSFRQKVKKSIQKQYEMIAKYVQNYAHLTTVVIWPKSDIGSRLMKFFVQELMDAVETNVVIVTENVTPEIQNLKEENDGVEVCQLALVDVMQIIQNDCAPFHDAEDFEYRLPTGDGTNIPGIDHKDANWLSEDFDVLYEKEVSGMHLDSAALKAEKVKFYKGGALTWHWLYEVGPGKLDIKREKHDKIVNNIKKVIDDIHETSTFTLYHSPGSGGSTMAKRILWDLKEFAPCVQIRSGRGHPVNVQGVCEKLQFIYSKTKTPVVALIDGEDGFDMDDLNSSLRDTCVMFLIVKRYVEETLPEDSRKDYWLPKHLSQREEEQMERQCLDESCTNEQNMRISELSETKGNNTIFDYGMALHSHKYTGIQSYVSSFLQLSEYTELQPWHISLAYLSLAYFYGQSHMPCMFFTHVLKSEQEIQNIDYFPANMKNLLIPDEADNRFIRICHVYIAREILDQVLAFPTTKTQPNFSQTITDESKRHLADISIRFIEQVGQICNKTGSSKILHIMKSMFIDRKWLPHIGAQPMKKIFISQILADMSRNEPYTERLHVMDALTQCFPDEAHFCAHYARLICVYTPENYQNAQSLFDKALAILEEITPTGRGDMIPNSLRKDLMQIYHMYGKMFQAQVSRITGKTMNDNPKYKLPSNAFKNVAAKILENVNRGCELFAKCREIAPLSCNESYGYISEMKLRLMYCKFIHYKSGCWSIRKFIEKQADAPEALYAAECCNVLDQLFLECTKAYGMENMTNELEELKHWAKCLFSAEEHQLLAHDDIRSIRWSITTIKMKYHDYSIYRTLENVEKEELVYITNGYEKILKDYDRNRQAISVSPMQIDSDFKEWIFAIRHPHMEKAYTVEEVLRFVELWYSVLKSRDSTFYLFVFKSIVGMDKVREGQTKLLAEAFELKNVLKKYKSNRKYPLEWLRSSNSSESFRRQLCPTITLLYKGLEQNMRTIENKGLEVLEGSILTPNNDPLHGLIILNIENKFVNQTITVFFVPKKTTEQLVGSRFANKRVEFVLGFGMRGYEAYNVKRLQVARCRSCATTSDIKSTDTTMPMCPKCGTAMATR